MKLHARTSRRRFLARTVGAAGALALSGCDALSRTEWFPSVLGAGEKLSQAAHHLLTPRRAMAQEFSAADLSPTFRSNGTAMPNDMRYKALAAAGFADYRLELGGLVEQPASLSLADLPAALRSLATIAWRAGARSANGRVHGSAHCWRPFGPGARHATSCFIAPIQWRMTEPAPTTRAST